MKLTDWRRVEEMRTAAERAARRKMAAAGTATVTERFGRDGCQMGLREGRKIEIEIGNLCIASGGILRIRKRILKVIIEGDFLCFVWVNAR